MRFNEIASAEEQLALWRLISTNVWSILNSQVERNSGSNKKQSVAKLRPPKAVGARKRLQAKKPLPPIPLPKLDAGQNKNPPKSATLDSNHPVTSYRSMPVPRLPGSSSTTQQNLDALQQQFQSTTNFK